MTLCLPVGSLANGAQMVRGSLKFQFNETNLYPGPPSVFTAVPMLVM